MTARSALRSLRHRIGRRGASLLFFAVLDLIYGSVLICTPPTPGTTLSYLASNWPPLPAWGAAWLAVGVVCLVQAFMRQDSVAFVCAMAIKVLWAAAHFWAFLDGAPRALPGVLVWFWAVSLVAVIATWPEPPEPDGGAL